MPIYTRFDTTTVSSVKTINTETLAKMFDEIIPMGAIIRRRQFYREYLPKYEDRLFNISGRRFSVRPTWTDYKPDPKHIIVIGHILLCHLFDGVEIYQQPSTRLWSDDIDNRLKKFRELLNAVNANKYRSPNLAQRKQYA